MNALINNFASADSKIAKAVRSLITITQNEPRDYRLMVRTPKESEPVIGMYAAEAQVILTLLDMAYNELVGTLNRVPRKDQIAVADRGRTLSEFDEEYNGNDEPEETYLSIEEQQEFAATAASMVHRYAEHIAAIKDGGAAWIVNGFSQPSWIAADPKDTTLEITPRNLPDLIKQGKVKRVTAHVSGRLASFKQWCETQLKSDWINVDWKAAIAYASVMMEKCPTVDVNDARDFIGAWAQQTPRNKTQTRLEIAITRVANRKWFGIELELQKGNAYISPASMLLASYSPNFAEAKAELFDSAEWQAALFTKLAEITESYAPQVDSMPIAERELIRQKARKAGHDMQQMLLLMPADLVEAFNASDEYEDFTMAKAVWEDTQAAKAIMRDAQRQVKIHSLAQAAQLNEETRKAAQALLDSLKPKATVVEAAPKTTSKAKAKAKVTKVPAVDAKPKAKKPTLKNVAGASTMPVLNTKGLRH